MIMGFLCGELKPRGYNLRQSGSNKKINRKSKFRKWLWRVLFLILLILLLLQFHHYNVALEGLARFNIEQSDMIHNLQQEVHKLELSNANLQIQTDMMKVKLNGIELNQLHNSVQNITPMEPHIQDIYSEVHTDSKVNIPNLVSPTTMITTAAVTIFTVIKGIASLVPAF